MSDDAKLLIYRALFNLYHEALETDVRRWCTEDQEIYRGHSFDHETLMVLVEQARLNRAYEAIRVLAEAKP